MTSDTTARPPIPVWFRLTSTIQLALVLALLVRAVVVGQQQLLGLPADVLIPVLVFVAILLAPVSLGGWLFPASAFSVRCFWLFRSMRELVYVLALSGILVLAAYQVPVGAVRGAMLYGILALFVIEGVRIRPAAEGELPQPLRHMGWRLRSLMTRLPLPWLQVCVSLAPVAAACGVVYFVFGSNLFNYKPVAWNDEIAYVTWLRSFVAVGFHSGYNAPNELMPYFSFSRFGEASPFYVYLYGMVGRLTGWFFALPVLVNFGLLAVATYSFLRTSRFDTGQTILAGLAILLTWPVLLFLPIASHETLNQSIGILTALLALKFSNGQLLGQRWKILLVGLCLFFFTLIRVSWGVLFIPFLFYAVRGSTWKCALQASLGGVLLAGMAIWFSGLFLPPINNSVFATLRAGVSEGVVTIGRVAASQFMLMFQSGIPTPNMVVVMQVLLIVGWGASDIWQRLKQGRPWPAVVEEPQSLQVYLALTLLAGGLVFYLQTAFHRAFAPVLLTIFLLQIASRDYKRLMALLAIQLVFCISYLQYPNAGVPNIRVVQLAYQPGGDIDLSVQDQINAFIRYDPHANDPWCNTLLLPLSMYDQRLHWIPAGIGVSYIFDPETYRPPIRSRYVLFDNTTYLFYRDSTRLEWLASLPIGDLYNNMTLDCR